VDLRVVPEAQAVPLAAALPLFQILQEALANVHLHAHATSVAVALDVAEGRIALTVEDDGVGLASGKAASAAQANSGLARMQAQMAALGGRFEIRNRGAGTRIVASLPIAARRA
jgi:two-component system sensor histidine kinase DegS